MFKMFKKKKPESNECRILWEWILVKFINRNNYKELINKDDSFKNGFMTAIECLRKELIKICD